jgi:hypothetical protein
LYIRHTVLLSKPEPYMEAENFDHLDSPKNLGELHHSLIANLDIIDAKSSKFVNVSLTSQNEVIVRAKLTSLNRQKLDIVVMPDILVFRKGAPSKTAAVDLKCFSHRVTHSRGYFEIKLVQKDLEAQLRLYSENFIETPPETFFAATRVLKTATKPIKTVFITRALNAVANLSEDTDEASLQSVAAAPSDFSVLVRALEKPEATEQLRKDDPLLPARIRAIQAKQQLLSAEGGTFSVTEVAKFLSISRQAVDKRRRLGRLIAVSRGRRGYVYPAWQFGEHGTLPGLERILDVLQRHDEWMKIAFMLNANTRLGGRRPLDELRTGRVETVLEAARSYGEQGAT